MTWLAHVISRVALRTHPFTCATSRFSAAPTHLTTAALPRIELFRALQELLSAYPTPPTLKHVLLDHLHNLLRQTLPFDPQAAKLLAARFLTPDLDTERVVDALSKATEELFRAALHADSRSRHGLEGAFAEFTLEWCEKPLDDNLVRLCSL